MRKARIWRQSWGHPALSDGTSDSRPETAVCTCRETSESFWAATRWPDCLRCGHPRRQLCFPVLRPLRLPYGFRAGWSLNSSTRCKHSTLSEPWRQGGTHEKRVMAVVGDNIRALHSQLTARGVDCTLNGTAAGISKTPTYALRKPFGG